SLMRGMASVILGVVALAWPDITLLVVAVVFGARTVLFGLAETIGALRRDGAVEPPASTSGAPARRWPAVARAGLALAVALASAGLSARLHEGTPAVDAFYDTPEEVPAEPGTLLRVERFTRRIPDGASAWRILYTTTKGRGRAGDRQRDRGGAVRPAAGAATGHRLGARHDRRRPELRAVAASRAVRVGGVLRAGPGPRAGLGARRHRLHGTRHGRRPPVRRRSAGGSVGAGRRARRPAARRPPAAGSDRRVGPFAGWRRRAVDWADRPDLRTRRRRRRRRRARPRRRRPEAGRHDV